MPMAQTEIKFNEHELPFVERDISWLDFNYRVLQEAKDPSVPLLERLKFIAIYSNNLDEFFRVRVAHHRNMVRVGKKTKRKLRLHPKQVLLEIQQIVNKHQEELNDIFSKEIVPELAKEGIVLRYRQELNTEQHQFIEQFFQDNLLPYVQPVVLLKNKVRPFLNNGALYLCLDLEEKEDPNKQVYAIVQVPSNYFPRFIEVPPRGSDHELIMLDDIVRHNIKGLFPGYNILDSYSIKLTRDAELYIDDEYSGDLLGKIKRSLAKRNVGPASRLVYDRTMPERIRNFLMDTLEIGPLDLLPEGRYHNNSDFFKFPDYGKTHLSNTPLPPLPYPQLEDAPDYFEAIREKDQLMMVPYHKYESVIQFFEQAAIDPAVTHIKIIQYRVASESRIMKALMRAVKSGKQVSAFIEVKARFDEEANLRWGEKLERAGVSVKYSFPGLKVHSKIALIRRAEGDTGRLYAYFSTGNFHEGTAKIYSDFGLFTADPRLTSEAARVFSFLETVRVPTQEFQHLLVGQFNLRRKLEEFIDFEIAEAEAGRKARINLKLNSLQDDQMLEKLYLASESGVDIRLNIRGLSCLVPGKKGFSKNICGISIVDRFLEHTRVFQFHHAGEKLIYLSSADWMERNLSFRIETTFPIYDPDLKAQILHILDIQWNDNVKARYLDYKKVNTYRKTDLDLAIRSQEETYFYFKRRNKEYLNKQEEMDTQVAVDVDE
jgi:polyphosphate kinase